MIKFTNQICSTLNMKKQNSRTRTAKNNEGRKKTTEGRKKTTGVSRYSISMYIEMHRNQKFNDLRKMRKTIYISSLYKSVDKSINPVKKLTNIIFFFCQIAE